VQCYNHPESGAVAACASCGKGVCETCAVEVGGRVYCKPCLAAGPAGVVPSGAGGDVRPTTTEPATLLLGLLVGVVALVGGIVLCCVGLIVAYFVCSFLPLLFLGGV
jgi:hypothetical protein